MRYLYITRLQSLENIQNNFFAEMLDNGITLTILSSIEVVCQFFI